MGPGPASPEFVTEGQTAQNTPGNASEPRNNGVKLTLTRRAASAIANLTTTYGNEHCQKPDQKLASWCRTDS